MFSALLQAQVGPQIDTLKKQLPTLTDDSVLTATYNKLGELYIYQDPDSALYYLQLAKDEAATFDFDFEYAKAQLLMAIRWEGISAYDSALYYNQLAYQSFAALQDTVFMGNALSNMGLVYEALGRKQEGLTYHLDALALFQAANDSLGIAKTYNNLGILFKTLGNYQKASQYYQEAAALFAAMNYRFGQAALLNNAASAQLEYAAYDSALINARAALSLYVAEGIEQYQSAALEVIGTAWYKLEAWDNAIDTLQLALQLYQRYDNQKEGSLVYRRLAECYQQQNDLATALTKADSALLLAQAANTFDEIAEAAWVLSQIEHALGRDAAAYQHLALYTAYYDSVMQRDNLATINELETKYQTEQKEKDLAEQALLLAKSENDLRTQQLQIGGLAALVIILVLFGLLYYRHIRNRQQSQLQAAVIEEQQRGIEAVFEATETERKRIAKDLHDGVGQQLTAIKRQTESLLQQFTAADPSARQLQQLIDETARETRAISHQMMPKALTELGLVPALEDLLQKSFSGTSIDHTFEYFNLQDRYAEKVEVALYRITQELINNILKHAKARTVTVQLYAGQGKLHLVVEDDGQGFTPAPTSGHGMRNMRNRLQTLGGQMQLTSEEGVGTTAAINLPVT